MINNETAMLLANYNSWADKTLFGAISNLPESEIYRSRNTLFGSMLGTLNHNYQVDLIWKANLLNEEHGFANRRDVLHAQYDELVKAQLKIDEWFRSWAEQQTLKSLREFVEFRFISGRPATMQKGSIYLHVVNHKTYHRGWISEMFFDADRKPPETDLCIYLEANKWADSFEDKIFGAGLP